MDYKELWDEMHVQDEYLHEEEERLERDRERYDELASFMGQQEVDWLDDMISFDAWEVHYGLLGDQG